MGLRRLVAAFAVSFIIQGWGAASAGETTLYTFTGLSDGGYSSAGLVGDSGGNLYGTTQIGGSGAAASCGYVHCGTVFKLSPPAAGKTAWTESVIYSFPGGISGFAPETGLVRDSSGALYGTSYGGDPLCQGGCGIIYKLTPPTSGSSVWTHSVLYSSQSFSGIGASTLSLNSKGELFGSNFSSIFELTPPAAGKTTWTFATIYTFGSSFAGATSGLVADGKGSLYGLVDQGGANESGGVYKLTPPAGTSKTWSAELIYSFPSGNGESFSTPAGLVFDSEGNLYGVDGTGIGYGEVFKLVPPPSGSTAWKGSSIYQFTGGNDGAYPVGLLASPLGVIYGIAGLGGSGCGAEPGSTVTECGTVFELTPPSTSSGKWTETTLENFNAYNGFSPNGGLIADTAGNLYGTTQDGGSWYEGVIFEVSNPAATKKRNCGPIGSAPAEPACIAAR